MSATEDKEDLVEGDQLDLRDDLVLDLDDDEPHNRIPIQRSPSFDPANRATLSWHNIDVYAKMQDGNNLNLVRYFQTEERVMQRKQLLKNVSGTVHPGQLLAIMGASGAGKTTLMNVLTNRNTARLDIEGDVKINGREADDKIARLCSYVQQDDLFIGTLTVKEHLIFQAMLRMDEHLTYKERMVKVDLAIAELGLSKCMNTMIGIPGITKSISGGERKRLAFASEVLTNPSIMFCDEPTSGLDSFMAQSVVSVLRNLAMGGRTIICTIHQPSSEVYAMFNNVLLMAEGRVAYMGDTEGAITFFERMGLTVPVNYNPSDFFVQSLAIVPGQEEACRERVQRICDEFAKTRMTDRERFSSFNRSIARRRSWSTVSKYKSTVFEQVRALTWRSFLSVIRDKRVVKTRFIQVIAIALIFGVVYYQQNLDQKAIMNIDGALFIMLTNMSFSCLFGVLNTFCLEIPIFLREHENGMYRTSTYFLCKTFAELPVFIAIPAVFTTIIYWMVGFNPTISRYLICVGVIVLVANTATSFGYMISSISNNITVALSLGTPLVIPLMLFGGFFLNTASIPVYLSWLKYISWYYYGNEALIINQWQGVQNITCNQEESRFCIPDGHAVISSFNFKEEDLLENILMLLVLLAFYRTLAFFALLMKANITK